jgi:ABC-2 type transport system permease protein
MRAIRAILARNLIKFFRDKMRFFFTLFMSGFLLFTFSFVMKSAVAGLAHPMNYLVSGIIIMTVFQTALNNSMSILEDISTGFMKEILVAPIARWQIAVGQVLSSAAVAVLQGVIVLVVGIFMGLDLDPVHFAMMVCLMLLVGITFSSLGLFLAALSKESTTFQIMISVVTMPLTFLSGAYIPHHGDPGSPAPHRLLEPSDLRDLHVPLRRASHGNHDHDRTGQVGSGLRPPWIRGAAPPRSADHFSHRSDILRPLREPVPQGRLLARHRVQARTAPVVQTGAW